MLGGHVGWGLGLLVAALAALALAGIGPDPAGAEAVREGAGPPGSCAVSAALAGLAGMALGLAGGVLWRARRTVPSPATQEAAAETDRLRRTLYVLRRIEEHYNSLVDNAPAGIFRTRPAGSVLFANPKMAQILGYSSPKELMAEVTDIGRQLYVDHTERTELYRRVMADNMVKNFEARFRRRDGEEVWLSLSLRAVCDDTGALHHVEGFAVNVTERRRAQEALAASEHMFRQMLRWMRDILYRLDPAGRIVFISQGVARFGYAPGDLYGRDILDLVHPDDRARCRNRINESRTGERRTSGLEFRLLPNPGNPDPENDEAPVLLLEAEGVYETDAAGSLRFLGSIGLARDITRRRRAEERLAHSLRAKRLLLGELQHRVKNNLQVILSLIELNRGRARTPEAQAVCREIEGYVRCMAVMHVMLSQREPGEQVSLGDMAREIFAAAAGLFGQGRITPRFALEDVSLHMDKALPCGMLLNELFINAFKHAFPGERPGSLDVEMEKLEDGRVRLLVADDGVGFPGGSLPGAGNGMGLRLIHSLAAQIKADLRLSGEAGVRAQLVFAPNPPRDRLGEKIQA